MLAAVAFGSTLASAGCTFLAGFDEKEAPASDAGLDGGDDDDGETPNAADASSDAGSKADAKAAKDAKAGG